MNKMEQRLHEMEARMSRQMEQQMKGMKEHFDRRLNQMFDVVMGQCLNPIYDYVEPSTSAVWEHVIGRMNYYLIINQSSSDFWEDGVRRIHD